MEERKKMKRTLTMGRCEAGLVANYLTFPRENLRGRWFNAHFTLGEWLRGECMCVEEGN